MYNNLYASWHITISIQINLLLVVEVDLLQSWMIMDQTICHSVVNDLICHSVWKYEVDFFLSLRLFSKAVIINFCHFLKWLTCNFSTWRDQWPVLPIYSVSSCPACTHLDSVIGTPNVAFSRNELSVQNIFGDSSVFHFSDMSQPAQYALTKHCW